MEAYTQSLPFIKYGRKETPNIITDCGKSSSIVLIIIRCYVFMIECLLRMA